MDGLSQFQRAKTQIDDIILRQSGIASVEESNDSTPKKLIYLIPFDQQDKIPHVLSLLE